MAKAPSLAARPTHTYKITRIHSHTTPWTRTPGDDLHMWLTPFTAGRHHYVFIDLGVSRTISMLRLWNYNKSRIHSYRGARYLHPYLPIYVCVGWRGTSVQTACDGQSVCLDCESKWSRRFRSNSSTRFRTPYRRDEGLWFRV